MIYKLFLDDISDRKYILNKLFCSVNFIHRIEQLFGNPPDSEGWLDNEALCRDIQNFLN